MSRACCQPGSPSANTDACSSSLWIVGNAATATAATAAQWMAVNVSACKSVALAALAANYNGLNGSSSSSSSSSSSGNNTLLTPANVLSQLSQITASTNTLGSADATTATSLLHDAVSRIVQGGSNATTVSSTAAYVATVADALTVLSQIMAQAPGDSSLVSNQNKGPALPLQMEDLVVGLSPFLLNATRDFANNNSNGNNNNSSNNNSTSAGSIVVDSSNSKLRVLSVAPASHVLASVISGTSGAGAAFPGLAWPPASIANASQGMLEANQVSVNLPPTLLADAKVNSSAGIAVLVYETSQIFTNGMTSASGTTSTTGSTGNSGGSSSTSSDTNANETLSSDVMIQPVVISPVVAVKIAGTNSTRSVPLPSQDVSFSLGVSVRGRPQLYSDLRHKLAALHDVSVHCIISLSLETWAQNEIFVHYSTQVGSGCLSPNSTLLVGLKVLGENGEQYIEALRPLRASCSWWNPNAGGSNTNNGGWSEEGCRLVSMEQSGKFTCSCSHLTNFAVLVYIDGNHNQAPSTSVEGRVLSALTIAGCALSVVCLTLVILTRLILARSSLTISVKVVIHLCASLFM